MRLKFIVIISNVSICSDESRITRAGTNPLFCQFHKKTHKIEKNSPWEERIPAIEICEDPEIDDGKMKLVHKKI